MRFVKISDEEMHNIKALYEGVMSYASHGLFFREGCVLGESIAKMAQKSKGEFFEVAKGMIVGRGWAEKIEFHPRSVLVQGSFEAAFPNDVATCHHLRGMIKRLYEINSGKIFDCKEVECFAKGSDQCTFELAESHF